MHPDKICDRIGDAILQEYLKRDPDARVAIETTGGHGMIFITGEVRSAKWSIAEHQIMQIIEKTTGKKYTTNQVIINIAEQSPEIAGGVDKSEAKEQGAGDQGIMVGYACIENEEFIPDELYLARKLGMQIFKKYPFDGKTQITLEYKKVKSIVASFQNTTREELNQEIDQFIGWLAKEGYNANGVISYANPAGDWKIGGFDADAGTTGRKLAVDNYGTRVPLGGGAFCVDGETEFLSEKGWTRINEYAGEKVSQYNNGKLEFVEPKEFIAEPCDEMYEIEGDTNISQALTGNHNFVYITSKNNIAKKPFEEIKKQHEESQLGFSGKIIPFFEYEYGNGIELNENEIRLQIAYMADGTENKGKPRVRLLKKNKIDRIKMLLDESGEEYEIRKYADGYTYFYFNPPFITKNFEFNFWKNCNKHQFEIIADEIVKWDGNGDNVYRTTIKSNADFIQFVFTTIEQAKCSIIIDDRVGEKFGNGYERKSVCYSVVRGKSKYCTLKRKDGKKLEIKKIEPAAKMKYCFTVPSGMLVLRRNDRIFVTGNSGKDSSKVDRSGAYKARQIALRELKYTNSSEVIVKIAYAIGVAEPLMVSVEHINFDGRERIEDKTNFYKEECKPTNIIKELDLKNPDTYTNLSSFGHFGADQPWERG